MLNTEIYVSLVSDINKKIDYTKAELKEEVISMIEFALEREYDLVDLNSNFILQDITNLLDKNDFDVNPEVHDFINSLILNYKK